MYEILLFPGNYTAALKATQDVLDIDPEDDVALKNNVTLTETLKTKKDKERKKLTKVNITEMFFFCIFF